LIATKPSKDNPTKRIPIVFEYRGQLWGSLPVSISIATSNSKKGRYKNYNLKTNNLSGSRAG
jgi:hypothetical protein